MDDKQIIIAGLIFLVFGGFMLAWSTIRLEDYNVVSAQLTRSSPIYQQAYENLDALQMISSYVLVGGIACAGYGFIKRRKRLQYRAT
jgi:hypothetical protein